jgi:hypothetical protein
MNKLLTALLLTATAATAHAGTYSPEVFQKVISGVGDKCNKVTEVFYSGSYNSEKMYSIQCTGGQSYMVKDGRNGSKVVACSVMAAIGAPCFKKF